MSDDVVLYEVSERIATITLNRPEARNALSSDVLRLLPELMKRADNDPDVDVVVLTGTDPAFCAGLDLKEIGAGQNALGRRDSGRWCGSRCGSGRPSSVLRVWPPASGRSTRGDSRRRRQAQTFSPSVSSSAAPPAR